MTGFAPGTVRVLTFDIFGTTVDWRSGVAAQVDEIARAQGVDLDGGAFADAWRDRYRPSLQRVNRGERDWAYLDALHRESLDELLDTYGVSGSFDEAARRRLVRTWHRLPAWNDSVEGLSRLRNRFVVAAFSNGGFALMTSLVKNAGLPFDCIISAELARTYKPERRAYVTAAALLDVDLDQVLMVAAHGWDLEGARSAGMRTAFVERPRERGPHGAADRATDVPSDITATSFTELADLLGC